MTARKTTKKKSTRDKSPSKKKPRKRSSRPSPEGTAPIQSPAPQGPPGQTQEYVAMPAAVRDELVSILRKKMPMEDAEGAVTILRNLPKVQLQVAG